MRRTRSAVLAATVPALLLIGSTGVATADAPADVTAPGAVARVHHAKLPTIHGSVGPGFEIHVRKHTVPAGRYRFVIDDRADIHNWHIFGPGGVDESTTVPEIAVVKFRATLVKGTYTIQCDPHADTLHLPLKVTRH